jgi:hypothetical protein
LRAACEHAHAAGDLALTVREPGPHGDALGSDANVLDAGAARDHRSSPGGAIGEAPIEPATVYDRRNDFPAIDPHGAPMTAMESRRTRDGADCVAGKIEFSEGVEAEDAGAVDGITDPIVLFEDEDREAVSGEPCSGGQTGRPCADHDHVPTAH